MLANKFFTNERLKEMRDEIEREGFVADRFLSDNPDSLVFGVNLACLYPFSVEAREAYETLAAKLSSLDRGVYVYPIWETHVTIATFINFTRNQFPTAERIAELKHLMRELSTQLEPAFRDITPFDLAIEQPVISRKAAILPLSDPGGTISKIRSCVVDSLERNPSLRKSLEDLGLNIPPLVHSTIMRFKKLPTDPQLFLSKFDEISRTVSRATMRVDEVFLTTETKPYMRAGEVFHRFQF